MGTIVYTPTGISHTTSVDFSKRSISQPVHIVQYDETLPILAVSLYNNGQIYRIPESADVSIRFGKPDKTFVYNHALGCNRANGIAYFEITKQMTLFHGEFYPVIEIKDGEKVANSSVIHIIIDKNPIQHDYVESTVEYKELVDYRNEAVTAAQNAAMSETNAASSASNAASSASKALQSEQNAKSSETNTATSASNALQSEQKSKDSEQNAKTSETNAASSASKALTSETNAASSASNAASSASKALQSEQNAKTSETNAASSASNAASSASKALQSEQNTKQHETNSKDYSELSKSYAVGTYNEIRENDSEDNAKHYYELAKNNFENSKRYAEQSTSILEEIIKITNTVEFSIDFETGELIQTDNSIWIFHINDESGELEWEAREQ